jgi:hypothetical protein
VCSGTHPGRELRSPGRDDAQNAAPSLPDGPAKAPIPVEVHQRDPAASEALVAMLRPLVGPFTTTGIVVIFPIFSSFKGRICATDSSDCLAGRILSGPRPPSTMQRSGWESCFCPNSS